MLLFPEINYFLTLSSLIYRLGHIQVMAWRQTCDKLLLGPMWTHIYERRLTPVGYIELLLFI